MTVRTRFAPSPTGFLHIGGARTALYAWLYARHHGGQFILRIEDTDPERSTKESIQAILDGMEWLGLDYDEGPFYQTQRMDRYQEIIEQLLKEDKAYRCYCSKKRLEIMRKEQEEKKLKPKYDRACRELGCDDADQPFVVRFRNPIEGQVIVQDDIRGEIKFDNTELDDLIIARMDGTPTYNFTVVVDDLDMNITHVVRGDDHINNTPRQINILKALGGTVPKYAHLPMILGPDGKRLSKRHGAASVLQYRDEGYLPQALLNYLVRLGWSHGDQEIFSIKEMTELFSLDAIHHSPAAINPEKLLWLNQHYIKSADNEFLANQLQFYLQKQNIKTNGGPDLPRVVETLKERAKTLVEMTEKSQFFFQNVKSYDEKAAKKNLTPDSKVILQDVHTQLTALPEWEKEALHNVVINTAEKHDIKLGKVAQPIRVAVTGNTISPPIDITLELLGKDRVLHDIEKAIEWIK